LLLFTKQYINRVRIITFNTTRLDIYTFYAYIKIGGSSNNNKIKNWRKLDNLLLVMIICCCPVIILAYVCGETKEGKTIFQEKPFEMGRQSLDIHTEMDLLEKKLDELRAMNVDEKTIKYALKDYGIERFIKFLPYFF